MSARRGEEGLLVAGTGLAGVLLITLPRFRDHRGEFTQLYDRELYRKHGVQVDFVQDDVSVSRRGVLRGIHGDRETWKLITALRGRIHVVVAVCDESSPDFGRWAPFLLTDRNRLQLLVPPGYGLAHLALSERIVLHYKQSTSYRPGRQFTYRWNDPRFAIDWPVTEPILSRRDAEGKTPGAADAGGSGKE